MNYKRAALLSLLAYVISFAVGILSALIFSVDFSGEAPVPQFMWYVGLLASILIMGGLAFWYFKSDTTKPSLLNGLMFGVIAIVVGFVIDALFFIPAALGGRGGELIAYYLEPFFWITLVAVIATTTLVGFLLGRYGGGSAPAHTETPSPKPEPETPPVAPTFPAQTPATPPISPAPQPEAPVIPPAPPTPEPEDPAEPTPPLMPPLQKPEPDLPTEAPETPEPPAPIPTPTPSPITPRETQTPQVSNELGADTGSPKSP